MYCPYCGKEIPTDSIFCRHCGKKQDNSSSCNTNDLLGEAVPPSLSPPPVQQQSTSLQKKKNYHALEAILFIVAFFIMIFVKCGPQIKSVIYEAIPHDNFVQSAAKELVSKEAVSPSSIKWKSVEVLEEDNYGRYIVDVQFESKNQFGVLIPSYVLVVLQSVKQDGSYEYLPFVAINDYESVELKSLGIQFAKSLNNWDVSPHTTDDNNSSVTDINIPESSTTISPSITPENDSNIPVGNQSLSDTEILSILEEASAAEYHVYTSYDKNADILNGMARLSPDLNTAEKIEAYLKTYWSDEDLIRIGSNIIFKDGTCYVPYGDPAAPKEYTKGQLIEQELQNIYDDNKNVVGHVIKVTVELTVYGNIESSSYSLSFDDYTNSWRVMTLY